MAHSSCSNRMTRRSFVSGCACACAGCAVAGSVLRPNPARAQSPPGKKPKIRVVFCETTNDKPIWPNIGYDFDKRRQELTDALTKGCQEVSFLFTTVIDDPAQAAEVLKGGAEVDGYVICLQGLGWSNDVAALCSTGKPTLVVDNLFGGSGKFLTQLPALMQSDMPVDWVSSSKDIDLVVSARQFRLLAQGASATDVAAAFRTARRNRTPSDCDLACTEDSLAARGFEDALEELKKTKLLVVGGGWGGDQFRAASQEMTGVTFIPIEFTELARAYEKSDQETAKKISERWMSTAQEVVEPTREDIEKSGRMYLAMKRLIDSHGARGISINCLGGFYGGHMEAYPCLGFSQLNDDGFVGGCEADQMSALIMAVMGALVGRPGFISDPVIDTSKNQIIYAHCVAMTKPFGPEGPSNPFRLRTHSEDRKGASMQSLLPAGYMTTTLELNPTTKQMLYHQAKSVGNNPSDMACRTKLEGLVKGDIEKLTEEWRMGWHRVTFYGDLREQVVELCDRMKLEFIEET